MAELRPRVLHVTRNLPPLLGGMERLNWHIADQLSRHAAVHVVGPTGASAGKPSRVALDEVPLRPLWRFLTASAARAVAIARRQRPDIVLAGSGLTAPAALASARACGARAMAYVHGLDLIAPHPVYRALWQPAIRRLDRVIANSRPTADLARAMGVADERLRIVHPGVQLPPAPQDAASLSAFRERFALGDARLLLSVGRLTTRKGLREFVRHSLPTIIRGAPDAVLFVIGDTPADSLHADVQTPQAIQAAADEGGVGGQLRFAGVVDDATLACAFESATAHVFPVRALPGDPEGFGMVAIEAAAHGLPTVAFAAGGVVDAVGDGESGYLLPQGDYSAFTQAVLRILADGHGAWRLSARTFAERFAWPSFGQRLAAAVLPAAAGEGGDA